MTHSDSCPASCYYKKLDRDQVSRFEALERAIGKRWRRLGPLEEHGRLSYAYARCRDDPPSEQQVREKTGHLGLRCSVEEDFDLTKDLPLPILLLRAELPELNTRALVQQRLNEALAQLGLQRV